MPGTPLQVLFHVPPQAGGTAVLGPEGQERRPEFLIVCRHRDSFPARPALPRPDTGEPIGVGSRACFSYIVLLAYNARYSTPYDDHGRMRWGRSPPSRRSG